MPGIDAYLKANPSLAGEDPEEIADFVFETQIAASGADRAEFREYFLGEQPGIIKRGFDAVVGAVKGNAEHPELGSMTDYAREQMKATGTLQGDGMGDALAFGNDEDAAAAIARAFPDLVAGEDKNGNAMFTMPDGTPAGYVNVPGLEATDVTRAGAKLMSFMPAAKGAQIAGRAKGLLARVSAGAAGAGATDAAMQTAAGRDEIDEAQVAMTAALGAGSEAVAPAAGRAVSAIAKRFGIDRWSRLGEKGRAAVMDRQLRSEGVTPEYMKGLDRELLIKVATERVERGAGTTPESSIARNEFGYQVTKGQSMPSRTSKEEAAKFAQLSKEETLRSGDARVGAPFRRAKEANVNQTDDNIAAIQSSLSGGKAQIDDPLAAAEIVKDGLSEAESSLKARVDDAYAMARDKKVNLYAEAVTDMPARMSSGLDAADVVLDDLTPAASNAMKEMERFASKYQRTGEDGIINDVPISAIERQRRRLGRFYDKASTPEDRRAVTILKGQFDDLLDETIDANLFLGDDEALEALKSARNLHREYSVKFRSNDEAGKAVQKMLDIDATPEQISQYMIGVSGLSKAGSARVARKYAEIVGKDSESWDALREMTFLTLARRPSDNTTKGAQALVTTLKRATSGNGSTLVKELYTNAEIAKMKRFATALEQTLPTGDFARSSGTAERILRFYNSGGFRSVPGLGLLMDEIDRLGAVDAFKMPNASSKSLSPLPAAGSYSTSRE